MRIKPPGDYHSDIGWLLEFRCMDCPITEVEKSALVFLTTLFMRIVTDKDMNVNFYVPISVVDSNYNVAMKRESIKKGHLIVRKNFCKLLDGY